MAREVVKSWAELCGSVERGAHLTGGLNKASWRRGHLGWGPRTGRIWTERHGSGEQRFSRQREQANGELKQERWSVSGPREWSVLAVKWEVEVRAASLGWGHAMQVLKCPSEESVVQRKGKAMDSSEQETVMIRVTWQRYGPGLAAGWC